jgi:hypothetical protein
MQEMRNSWEPPSLFTETRFAHHAEQLSRLWDEVRKEQIGDVLDKELFPGWNLDPTATGHDKTRKDLYLCQSILQLMENVYLDLHLDTELEHADNKGWRELFVYWAGSTKLKLAYDLSGSTYGRRFQKFFEHLRELNKRGPH